MWPPVSDATRESLGAEREGPEKLEHSLDSTRNILPPQTHDLLC